MYAWVNIQNRDHLDYVGKLSHLGRNIHHCFGCRLAHLILTSKIKASFILKRYLRNC